MSHSNHPVRLTRRVLSAALASCLALAAPAVLAQSTAATVRGQVTLDSAPAAEATVTATNLDTGLKRTVTAPAGSYNVGGLPPGTYRIDVSAGGQSSSKVVTLQVGQTATLNVPVGGVAETATAGEATNLDTVKVTAEILAETKTSEIATYVSPKQIDALPQNSRNFLAFADIVPGIQFNTGTEGSTSLRSGSQNSNAVNVFIDGVGQKDYVLKGGITGQDSSRGNPFPQLGIGEYKVITSNYKAEYDQLSSAAVTAVTKSGTNEFHGDFFWDRTGSDWTAKTEREERGETVKPRSKTEQYGIALGGPIIEDAMHFFVTYEGKDYNTPRSVIPGRQYPVENLPPDLQAAVRDTVSSPFSEDLYFGKIDWTLGDAHLLELTMKRREEEELTNIGGTKIASNGTNKTGEETRIDLRYQYSADTWLNDAHVTYEDSSFGPRPANLDVGYQLFVPRRGEENLNNPAMEEVLLAGGGGDFQNKGQKGYGFQDDLTFFGWEGHTIKMGVKYKSIDFNAFEQSPYTPQFRYDVTQSFDIPYFVQYTASGNGYPTDVVSKAKQFGVYIQDDWDVNEHLTLNLGLRWDYEENPSYENHVTPDALVAALQAWPNINNANVDYNYQDYISNGNNRSTFKDGWQPRVGFSYDINGDERHVIFGGAGRSYNRNQFDYLSYEKYRLAFQRYELNFSTPGHQCTLSPTCVEFDPSFLDPATLAAYAAANASNGSEVFLINNDLKTPYSDQFSLGMRNAFGLWGQQWLSSVSVVRVESKDGILFTMGNRYPDGEFRNNDLDWGGQPWDQALPGWGRFFLGNNAVETRTTSLLVSLEKPYTADSGWGMTLAYTYNDAEENRTKSDNFSFDYPNLDNVAFTQAVEVPEHRLVMTGIADFYGMTLSGKLTLATPKPLEGINCLNVDVPNNCYFDPVTPDTTLGYKQFDVALQKEWQISEDMRFRMRGDIFNLFNWRNYSQFDTYRGGYDEALGQFVANNNYRDRTSYEIEGQTRTFKLTFGLNW
ncbi:TonB-dependent receptor [Pseudoxanthomonas dokdonensis]|uniref:TonB-dependent transporter Oar-like beta-barrel domain-containing protein n=1 Tax=Pseudoxanthomonas dokdonensis TaxID=344882 RepID=A0A0R0CHF9_9GAMM|nr:TonB-dependent receptor [Pseudoxanthomonas dokdonensis]KRG68811.1 hypothetical protein ABB29_09985 [Pseudoxanthomonas dokdonensis]